MRNFSGGETKLVKNGERHLLKIFKSSAVTNLGHHRNIHCNTTLFHIHVH